MRGADQQQSGMFSYISAERQVPKEHPLRTVRVMVDAALKELGSRFDELYASGGRPSIAPEKLLRALLLQVLYTVRSERMLMEQLDYNFLFRWFVGLSIDDPVWDVTVFTKNRERLLKGEVAQGFFNAVVEQARAQGLLSDEHFTVDGTLIEAWAGHKSLRRKADDPQTPPDDPGNPSLDFHGERRRNATHQSTTDPEARLARKGGGQRGQAQLRGPRGNGQSSRPGGQHPTDSGLEPAEDLLDPFAPPLAEQISRAAGGAAIDRAVRLLCNVQSNPMLAQLPHQLLLILALVGARATWPKPAISSTIAKAASGSARPRPWAGGARLVIVESLESVGPSPLLLPPTTWSGCAT